MLHGADHGDRIFQVLGVQSGLAGLIGEAVAEVKEVGNGVPCVLLNVGKTQRRFVGDVLDHLCQGFGYLHEAVHGGESIHLVGDEPRFITALSKISRMGKCISKFGIGNINIKMALEMLIIIF